MSVSIALITKHVADRYGVQVAELFSKDQRRRVAEPRQVAMYLGRTLSDVSQASLGRRFGRSQSTVSVALVTIEERLRSPAFREELARLVVDIRLAHAPGGPAKTQENMHV